MSDPTDDEELLARLQAADPVKRAPVPSDDWIHDLTEATMTNPDQTPRRRTWLLVAAAAVVVGVLGVGGVAALNNGDDKSPPAAAKDKTQTTLVAPAPSEAKCMVPSSDLLSSNAQTAVDATVVSIGDGQVTLDVNHWYVGEPTDQLVVTDPSPDMQDLVGAVDLEQGGRYLLAGSGGELMACGFSGPYADPLAALYGEAFGS
jgi:hypothetical protein